VPWSVILLCSKTSLSCSEQGKNNKSSWVFTSRLRRQPTNNDPSFYKLQVIIKVFPLQATQVKLPKIMEVQENGPSEMHKSRKAMLRAAVDGAVDGASVDQAWKIQPLQATQVKLPKIMEVQENGPSEMHKSRKAMLRAAVDGAVDGALVDQAWKT
jgi:hypothetical protein